MTAPLQLTVTLHLRLPPAWDESRSERAWRDCFQPVIGALHHTPEVRLGLVLAGQIVQDLSERHPEGIEWIRGLLGRGQVELVGTPLHEPLVSLVPERDLAAQLQAHGTALRKVFGVRPTGAWLPYGAWDPVWPRVLASAGIAHSYVPDRQLEQAGERKGHVFGVYRTERDGHVVALLPTDERVAEVCGRVPVKKVLGHLQRRAQRSHGLVNLALEAGRFGLDSPDPKRANAWFATLLAALAKARNQVQTLLPSDAAARAKHQGRIYLGETTRAPMRRPVGRYLVRYPEGSRLHRKMIRVSRLAEKIERIAADPEAGRKPDPTRLLQVKRYLHRAQNGAVYWHHESGGVANPALRALGWKDLLRGEQLALRALRVHKRYLVERIDFNGDGVDEISATTPAGVVVVDPALGGGLTEFSSFATVRNHVDTFTRLVEPYHQALHDDPLDGDAVPVASQPEDETVTTRADHIVDAARRLKARACLGVDTHPRACFIDRFLDESASVASVREGSRAHGAPSLQTAPWEVISAERYGRDAVRCALATDAVAETALGPRDLRLSKRYTFKADGGLDVRHEVLNRSHEVLRTRYAIELNLGLAGLSGDLVGLVVGGRPQRIEDPGDAGEATELRITAGDVSTEVVIDREARIWHYPIFTVDKDGDQFRRVLQGLCVLLVFPVEVWGQEKVRATVSLGAVAL